MFVLKRNGSHQEIDVEKIRSKARFFASYIYPLNKVDLDVVVDQVKLGLHNDISTSEIDVFTAKKCMEIATTEPEYGILAARILIDNHHKNTLTGFKDKMEKLYRRVDDAGKSIPLLDRTFYKFVCTNQRAIEAMIDYQRDFLLDAFGFLTLEKQYISRIEGKCVERPQDLFMKEAIALCMNLDDFNDKEALNEIWIIYDLLSTQKFTYATPTLNNSGMSSQQLSSCFLLGIGDSLEEINKCLDDAARISKFGGGIGIHVSSLRSAGQLIRGTNGKSSGIRNFMRMFGTCADAYNQGGKRNGSFAMFLRDYHPDLLEFIQLKNPIGDESQRARQLFLCVALSDLFWRKIDEDGDWYFVDPEEHYGLDELYGEEFEKVMARLIEKKRWKKKMKARDILKEIMKQQFESGVPYLINFDHINRKNNLSHYGPIRSSNLCVSGDTEILTHLGYLPIRNIVEDSLDVNVWNGEEFTPAVFSKTGVNQALLEICTSDGESVKCTPYHKFYVTKGNEEVEVRAKDLKPGDKLSSMNSPPSLENVLCMKEIEVISIRELTEREDTYCFNEPKRHRGVFNGIPAGNCVEICLPSSTTEYGVCNLASLVLPSYVTDDPSGGDLQKLRVPVYQRKMLVKPQFDYKGLAAVTQVLTRTMDRVIDRNHYPVREATLSNLLHRPIGIGSSGLADVCCLMRIPYDSKDGVKLSAYIAETIDFSSMSTSTQIARELTKKIKKYSTDPDRTPEEISNRIFGVYNSYKKWLALNHTLQKMTLKVDMNRAEYEDILEERNKYIENPLPEIIRLAKQMGSYPSYYYGTKAPIAKGIFQWKMWGLEEKDLSGMWDWGTLESHIAQFGIRNSLTTAQMPTATTAQIMGVNEGVEPFTANMYRRAVLSGEYIVFNKYLIQDLITLGLWSDDLKNYLIASGGSIQKIENIPQGLKDLYKTAWDMGQKIGADHAVARGPFLHHSQSFNIFIGNSTDIDQRASKLYKVLRYGYKKGLKTGIYYLRTQPAIEAQPFSIPLETLKKARNFQLPKQLPTIPAEDQGCLLCGT